MKTSFSTEIQSGRCSSVDSCPSPSKYKRKRPATSSIFWSLTTSCTFLSHATTWMGFMMPRLSLTLAILGKSKISSCAEIAYVFFFFLFFFSISESNFGFKLVWCKRCPSFPFLLFFSPSLSLSLLKSLISSRCMCCYLNIDILNWTPSIY